MKLNQAQRKQIIGALSQLEGYAHLQVLEDLAEVGETHSQLIKQCLKQL